MPRSIRDQGTTLGQLLQCCDGLHESQEPRLYLRSGTRLNVRGDLTQSASACRESSTRYARLLPYFFQNLVGRAKASHANVFIALPNPFIFAPQSGQIPQPVKLASAEKDSLGFPLCGQVNRMLKVFDLLKKCFTVLM